MARIRPGIKKEEWLKRYIESAVISAVRQKRYLQEYQNLPEEIAVLRAVNQALGMIASGGYREAKRLLEDIEKLSRVLKEKLEFDCIECSFIPSLNLFRKDDVRKKEAGGEWYVLYLTLSTRKGLAIYHNSGGLIGSLEDILMGLHNSLLRKASDVHIFLWHAIRDLKASLFFAFCGRYRNALATLRSSLEFLFTGIYFQSLKRNQEEYEKEWKNWIKGKNNFFGKGKKCINDAQIKNEAGKLYGELSQAVHVFIKDEFEIVVEKCKKPARPASAFFETEFLEEWFDYFIRLIFIFHQLIPRLIEDYKLRETKRSKGGLRLVKRLLENLKIKNNRNKPLNFVSCPKLKDLNL